MVLEQLDIHRLKNVNLDLNCTLDKKMIAFIMNTREIKATVRSHHTCISEELKCK